MVVSNRDRINRSMDLLMQGLGPLVIREMRAKYGDSWWQQYQSAYPAVRAAAPGELDAQGLLKLMRDEWRMVFGNTLGNFEKNLVHELIDARNRWAHQESFNVSDTERVLDSVVRLLQAVSANEQVELVERERQAVRRAQFEEYAKREERKASTTAIQSPVTGSGLRSWRDVITPHPDVQRGVFQRAEFAADLAQVHRGEGTDEYADPIEFFRRTYLTEGLRTLILGGVRRLAGAGGDPVIELQTNFGGGKTHSMLALYHIASNVELTDIPGLEPIIQELAAGGVKVADIPVAKRAVLVGTALGPNEVRHHDDGTDTRTLWGELAWQLGRRKGYALVEASDVAGTNPGADILSRLFNEFSPALILIDEWVAFVRQLYGVNGLAAGSFDANLSFAQSLTEAVRQSDRTLLVASLPSSDIEIGGEGGKEALERLRNTFGRMQASWRPATTEEGFEIVRRRLFEPIADSALFTQRDAVLRAYSDMYRKEYGQFPTRLTEGDYRRRMEAAYPIHPELFDQLYDAWSTLDKFQRTRGVLRLMASVIHTLWARNDQSLLIMPANVPMDAGPVVDELTRYLDDPWKPVIERDVDGEQSLPIQLDTQNPNFGRLSASRRVARTVYLGSAPTFNTANRGIDDRDIKLGVVQPGENAATFGDALRTLSDRATHLYVDRGRYWYSTQPSVLRTAQERAQGYSDDAVYLAIAERLRNQEAKQKSDFVGVHVAPGSTADVRDEPTARLVILDSEYPHLRNSEQSEAVRFATTMLSNRGDSPRLYRNTLVFAAPDAAKLTDLAGVVRDFLAWDAICKEAEQLNLDSFQRKQAENKLAEAEAKFKAQLAETYQWVLVPRQDIGSLAIEWDISKALGSGSDSITTRVSQRLRNDDLLRTTMAGTLLANDLRRVLWRTGDHVSVKQLADYYAQYLYLARLKNADVLLDAVADGAASMLWSTETFALAERYNDETGRYEGLSQAGLRRRPTLDPNWVVVRPDVAQAQLDADRRAEQDRLRADRERQRLEDERLRRERGEDPIKRPDDDDEVTIVPPPVPPVPPVERKTRRYWANVDIDPVKMASQSAKISQEIVQHLQTLVGADVTISIEINAKVPGGIPDDVLRVLRENSSVLKIRYDLEEN